MLFENLPNKTYQIIVVDPPWMIKKIARNQRPNQVKMDYPTLSVAEISTLPVADLAQDSCWLFLWTIQRYLFQSKEILEQWGFNFLLTMVWEKTYGRSAGMPLYGFRWNAEFILVGYKQKPELWPKRGLIPAVFQAPNVRHSEKPDRFYELVAPLGEPRLDMFARKSRAGWDVWGNEC